MIDLALIDDEALPFESSIAALTLAELTAGPLSTRDVAKQAERLERLQWAESKLEAIPFDTAAAHAYGRIYSVTVNASMPSQLLNAARCETASSVAMRSGWPAMRPPSRGVRR